jgi:DNA mismatch repair protein MutL
MGRIHILSDQVANQIAAGEVVERPASVVKELLENSIDAGATRIRIEVEAGGRKLIRIADNGHGMVRDDALLAFERHATSKLRTSDDLLSIATLGFRGEALPSIASVARLTLETRAAAEDGSPAEDAGTLVEIAGGNILRADPAGVPVGTTITIRDLFFNTPARRKFLKSEQTELAHIAALVTHYALAHPTRHFELHTSTQALLIAPAVSSSADRLFQIFGRETSVLMLPLAAEMDFRRAGLPEPPPWKRDEDYEAPDPGFLRISGFVSKPELQKLNRNSIYVFVNRRLIRDRLVLHALTEAYRNILPPTSFPVVLLFLEMPPEEVDVNVHPAKTEVRFRQPAFVHDFLRNTIRAALIQARPAASFASALSGGPHDLNSSLMIDVSPLPGEPSPNRAASRPLGPASETLHRGDPGLYAPGAAPLSGIPDPFHQPGRAPAAFNTRESDPDPLAIDTASFSLSAPSLPPTAGRLSFDDAPIPVGYPDPHAPLSYTTSPIPGSPHLADTLNALSTLKPLGQLRDSFILATNDEGLWIIDQHVAHERILFEKVLRERRTEGTQRQRLLMPLLIDLLPEQMIRFADLADELERNGFEAEPFGARTLAIKAAPTGLEGRELELTLGDILSSPTPDDQVENAGTRARRIAASIACHAAIKINTPLESSKLTWLLEALAQTEHPTSCPHGRPIALRYSHRDIARAFQRT